MQFQLLLVMMHSLFFKYYRKLYISFPIPFLKYHNSNFNTTATIQSTHNVQRIHISRFKKRYDFMQQRMGNRRYTYYYYYSPFAESHIRISLFLFQFISIWWFHIPYKRWWIKIISNASRKKGHDDSELKWIKGDS